MKTYSFFLVYAIANLSLVLYGVLLLIMPGIMYQPILLNGCLSPESATAASAYLLALNRLLGFFNLLPGIVGLLLLQRLWVSQEAWIPKLLILSTALAYLGPIVFDNTVGSIGFFEIVEHLLFFMVIILGLLMWRDINAGMDFDRSTRVKIRHMIK